MGHLVSRIWKLSLNVLTGSLHDDNVRFDMNNLIFHKLQNVIERPCRSTDWFSMAEQAINAIYVLGDHPDVLCNNLIKNLTRRAFTMNPNAVAQSQESRDDDAMDEDAPGPTQASLNGFASTQPQSQADPIHGGDVGDAFELSQMIFVVGHVAIKHIVYLELVEREWKRQKNEHEAGIAPVHPSHFATKLTRPISGEGQSRRPLQKRRR